MYFVKILFYLYSTSMTSNLRSLSSEQVEIETPDDDSNSDFQEEPLDMTMSFLKSKETTITSREMDIQGEPLDMTTSFLKNIEQARNSCTNSIQETLTEVPTVIQKRKNIEITNVLTNPNKRRKNDNPDLNSYRNAESNKRCDESYKNSKKNLQEKINECDTFIKSKNSKLENDQESIHSSDESITSVDMRSSLHLNKLPFSLRNAVNIKCPQNIDKYNSDQLEIWIDDFVINFNKILNFTWDTDDANKTITGIDKFTSFFSVDKKNDTEVRFQFNKQCIILECLVQELIPLIYYLNINKDKFKNWTDDQENFMKFCYTLATEMNNWVIKFKINLSKTWKNYSKGKREIGLCLFINNLSRLLKEDLNIFRNILLGFLYLFIDDRILVSTYHDLIVLTNAEFTLNCKKKEESLVCLLFIFFIVNRKNNLDHMSLKILEYKNQYIDAIMNITTRSKIPFRNCFTSNTIFFAWINEIDFFVKHIYFKNESFLNFNKDYKQTDNLKLINRYIHRDKIVINENIIKFKKKITCVLFFKISFLEFMRGLL